MIKGFWIALAAMLLHLAGPAQSEYFRFSTLPDLPANAGYSHQPGLAGPYTGMDDGVLILAGGANFPDRMPWAGGVKRFYNEIFLLQKDPGGEYAWQRSSATIPFSSAYGGSLETPAGLLCFGGNTADEVISESWFIDFIPETGEVVISPGPVMPVPLTNFAFARVNGTVFVAGGLPELDGASGSYFFRLQMAGSGPAAWTWEDLPSWAGEPRAFAVAAGQSNGLSNCFYLFSGRKIQPGKDPEILYDAHVFDPVLKQWNAISEGKKREFPLMAGTAFPVGAATIVFASGADGEMMEKQLAIEKQIASFEFSAINQAALDSLRAQLNGLLNTHPGFGSNLNVFNTITREFYPAGIIPGTGQVTTTAVRWGDDVLIPSGEIRPGVRTPDTLKISIIKENRHLTGLDITVIGLYFLILAGMGWYFSRRQKSTNDYFKGGGRVPWWAAGLSIFGTALSAITFMAIPSKTFATDWSYFMLNMTIFLAAPIIVFLFIPFYRRLDITTAYEYLESRFSLVVRLIGSLSFILFQVGRMGVVLFLPSIALNVVSGIDIFLCIGLMGVIALIYTMMGGIEAVIWTDVMQVIVLLGGAILALVIIFLSIEGGFPAIVETAAANHKFNIIDLSLTLKQPTLWVMLTGGLFTNIITYGTDQTMVQRYLTTSTEKAAKKSVWTNAVMAVPATLIFFFTGTALFVFYKVFPQEMNPTFANNDAIFPWYIASQLPPGLSGLLIAGIFAAAMSTLSSSMNSAATAWSTDVHFRFGWNSKSDRLKIARTATLIIGIIGILFAFFMATMDIKSLWDEFQKILGLVIGSLGGVFLLGILTKRANSPGVIAGIIFSIIVQVLVAMREPVHLILYSATGVISCFLAGYAASLFFKKQPAR